MTTAPTIQRFQAGVELAQKIQRAIAQGLPTVKILEIENRLGICRQCVEWEANDCRRRRREAVINPDLPEFLEMLIGDDCLCLRWVLPHLRETKEAPRPKRSASGQDAKRVERALARMHAEQEKRSQSERRAARCAARRRKAAV